MSKVQSSDLSLVSSRTVLDDVSPDILSVSKVFSEELSVEAIHEIFKKELEIQRESMPPAEVYKIVKECSTPDPNLFIKFLAEKNILHESTAYLNFLNLYSTSGSNGLASIYSEEYEKSKYSSVAQVSMVEAINPVYYFKFLSKWYAIESCKEYHHIYHGTQVLINLKGFEEVISSHPDLITFLRNKEDLDPTFTKKVSYKTTWVEDSEITKNTEVTETHKTLMFGGISKSSYENPDNLYTVNVDKEVNPDLLADMNNLKQLELLPEKHFRVISVEYVPVDIYHNHDFFYIARKLLKDNGCLVLNKSPNLDKYYGFPDLTSFYQKMGFVAEACENINTYNGLKSQTGRCPGWILKPIISVEEAHTNWVVNSLPEIDGAWFFDLRDTVQNTQLETEVTGESQGGE